MTIASGVFSVDRISFTEGQTALRDVPTAKIPPGFLVFVNATKGLYFWDPDSAAADDGLNVVEPNLGAGMVGRFLLYVSSGGAGSTREGAYTAASTSFSAGIPAIFPLITPITSANFVAGPANVGFSHAAGILTYTGSAAKNFPVRGLLTGNASADGTMILVILRDGIVPAGTAENVGINFAPNDTPTQVSVDTWITVTPGQTLQLGIARGADSYTLSVVQATLQVGP